MDIPLVHEDGTENELDLPLCCEACSKADYGFSTVQFNRVKEIVDKGTPLKVPDDITTLEKLVSFIKTC